MYSVKQTKYFSPVVDATVAWSWNLNMQLKQPWSTPANNDHLKMENINLPQNQINGNIVKCQNLKVNKCQNTWYIPKEMESVKTLNMKKSQNYGITIRSNFTHKRKSHDNSRIEQGFKTTHPPQNMGPMIMLVMLTCFMLWCAIIWYDSSVVYCVVIRQKLKQH